MTNLCEMRGAERRGQVQGRNYLGKKAKHWPRVVHGDNCAFGWRKIDIACCSSHDNHMEQCEYRANGVTASAQRVKSAAMRYVKPQACWQQRQCVPGAAFRCVISHLSVQAMQEAAAPAQAREALPWISCETNTPCLLYNAPTANVCLAKRLVRPSICATRGVIKAHQSNRVFARFFRPDCFQRRHQPATTAQQRPDAGTQACTGCGINAYDVMVAMSAGFTVIRSKEKPTCAWQGVIHSKHQWLS